MKYFTTSSLTVFVLTALLVGAISCKREKEKKEETPKKPIKRDFTFSGKVSTPKGEPIDDAEVTVNGKPARSGKDGSFRLVADSSGRFVLNIRKRGFSPVSRVFHMPSRGHDFKMKPAFVTTIDPRKKNVIRDLLSQSNCQGSGLQGVTFNERYQRIPFIYNSKGRLVDFGWPSGVKDIYQYATGPAVCNPGATLTIPANAIMNASQQLVTTPVTVSIATLDVQSADGMPGDWGYSDGAGSGMMVSAGAVSIETYSKEESYNIHPKAKVKLELPVEPAMLKFNKKMSDEIPMFYYDDKQGLWIQEEKETGKYNKRTKSYEAQLRHFSAINFDYKIPNVTCLRFRQSGAPVVDSFTITIFSKQYGYGYFKSPHGDENSYTCLPGSNGGNLHLAYRIPASDSITFLLQPSGTPTIAYGIAILATGADPFVYDPMNPPDPNCGDCAAQADPCRDPASGKCNDQECNVITPGPCSYLNLNTYPDNIIIASQLNNDVTPTFIKLAIVLKSPPAVGTLYDVTYQLYTATDTPIGAVQSIVGIKATGEADRSSIPYDATVSPAKVKILTCSVTTGSSNVSQFIP